MNRNTSPTEQLRDLFQHPAMDVYIEAKLAQNGILSILEDAGIVPVVSNPNQFDPTTQQALHDNWWREHDEAASQFQAELVQREQALKQVYMGMLLSSL